MHKMIFAGMLRGIAHAAENHAGTRE